MAFAGVSGLNAAAADLDNIGNNIANANTTAYKTASTQFEALYSNAQAGMGVAVAGVTHDFTSGAMTLTNRSMDVAIDGNGFFRMSDAGSTDYSRDGHFVEDKDGFLENTSGALLTGYTIADINNPLVGVNTSGIPSVIQIPNANMNARATTQTAMTVALDAGAPLIDPAVTPFAASDTGSYDWAAPMTVYDSLGNAHTVTLYFTKTATDPAGGTSTWQVNGEIAPAQGAPDNTAPLEDPLNPGDPLVATLTFDSTGNLVSPGEATGYTVPGTLLGNGASALNFSLDLAGTTQTAQPFVAGSPTQDGFTSGGLTGISISRDGSIVGNYDNGQTVTLAQIALATFRNDDGLKPVSGNAWAETAESGQPALGTPGTGEFGTLASGALEGSNIDLAQQLVDLIESQRNYQANAQTIKTQSEILQSLVTMS